MFEILVFFLVAFDSCLRYNRDSQQWDMSDAQIKAIYPACVQNPDSCALAKRSPKATAEDLENQVLQLLARLQSQHLAWGKDLIDYTTVKEALANTAYSYHDGGLEVLTQQLATYLDLSENRPVSPPPADTTPAQQNMVSQMSQETLLGIHCLDRNARLPPNSPLDSIMPAVNELRDTGKYLADADIWSTMVCANWKIEPPEKFDSDFTVAPRSPDLMLSNSVDPNTPVVSAYNLSSTVQNSAVLITQGNGVSGPDFLPSRITSFSLSLNANNRFSAHIFVKSIIMHPSAYC